MTSTAGPPSRDPGRGLAPSAWVRFARPAARAAAGVAVGAGHGVVPDDPPDPRRPGAGGARADRAGRPGRRRRGRRSASTTRCWCSTALPPGPVHRRPRHLDRSPSCRCREIIAQRLPATLAAGGPGVPASRSRSPSRSASAMAVADPARPAAAGPSSASPRPAWCSASIPDFLLGVVLVYVFARQARLAPGRGQRQPRRRTSCRCSPSPSARPPILARIVRVEMVDGARGRLRPHRPRQAAARPARSTSATRCPTR